MWPPLENNGVPLLLNSNLPPGKMQAAGRLLSWLTGSAMAGMLVFCVALVLDKMNPQGPVAQLVASVAPVLIFVILAAEAVAVVLLLVGIACWPSRIVRSRRWVLSAVGLVFVATLILLAVYIYVVIATSLV